jgi:hypothetical protein
MTFKCCCYLQCIVGGGNYHPKYNAEVSIAEVWPKAREAKA